MSVHSPLIRLISRPAARVAPALLLFVCVLAVSSSAAAQGLSLGLGGTSSSSAPDPDAASHVDRQLSLGGAFTHTSSRVKSERAGSALVGQFGSLDSTRLGWVQRSRTFAMLGGGTADVEGGIGGELSAGPLFETSPGRGSFARGGLAAELLGNSHFYSSWITLPRLELGYRAHTPDQLLEAAVFVAPAWTGRVKLSDQGGNHRLGGSVEHGALLALVSARARFDIIYQRFAGWNIDGVTHLVRVAACGHFGRPSVCFRGRLYEAPQEPATLERARIAYFGLFLGLGPLIADP